MARPRYGDGDRRARDNLIFTFWSMLKDRPYGEISVRALLRETGMAKNTFYYHFGCLDDLSKCAVSELLLPELFSNLIHGETPSPNFDLFLLPEEIAERFDHLSILMSDHAAALQPQFMKSVIELWCEELGCEFEELPERKQMLMRFLCGGIIGLLNNSEPDDYRHLFSEMSSLPLVKNCIQEFKS